MLENESYIQPNAFFLSTLYWATVVQMWKWAVRINRTYPTPTVADLCLVCLTIFYLLSERKKKKLSWIFSSIQIVSVCLLVCQETNLLWLQAVLLFQQGFNSLFSLSLCLSVFLPNYLLPHHVWEQGYRKIKRHKNTLFSMEETKKQQTVRNTQLEAVWVQQRERCQKLSITVGKKIGLCLFIF